MADHRFFDAEDFLETRYKDVSDSGRVHFLLSCFHEVFQSLPYSLKILEYGSGPVIQHTISAAAHASELVFSDFAESNREAVRKWLRRDPTAFNWSPHFDYVVKTLEGKGEKEAREREELTRKVVKAVVHCDIFAESPIEKGFEGPYDVLIDSSCLQAACTTPDCFKKGVITLSRLIKSGGTIISRGMDISMEQSTVPYTVGGKQYNCLCVEKEFVADCVKEAGFSSLHMHSHAIDASNAKPYITEKTGLRGHFFIHAKKNSC